MSESRQEAYHCPSHSPWLLTVDPTPQRALPWRSDAASIDGNEAIQLGSPVQNDIHSIRNRSRGPDRHQQFLTVRGDVEAVVPICRKAGAEPLRRILYTECGDQQSIVLEAEELMMVLGVVTVVQEL